MTANVLAIDQGTSGTKAVVVCPDRGILAAAVAPVTPVYGPDGSVEVDARSLLASVVQAGRGALALAGEPVAAVGLANQGETVLAWDRGTGEPLGPALVWQDRRASAVCDDLREQAAWLTRTTGLPLDPYFAAPKLAWLRRERTQAGVVTTSDAWLVHQLTGAFVTDASTASRTMLLDLDRADWSAGALAAFGLDGEELPAVVDCNGMFGTTGVFGPRLPLTGLVVDQQAALLAQGCLRAGQAKCTYGTGAFLLAQLGGRDATDRAPRSAGGLSTSVAWRLAGEPAYCADGQVFTVGSAVGWLTRLGVISGPEDLDRLGGSVEDTGGVRLVPALGGLGAPHWRPDATGSLTGLTLSTTPAHVARALVDGIAAAVTELVHAAGIAAPGPLDALRVDGGLTRSRVLMQTQADLLQVPVEVAATADATALGAAALAGRGLDGWVPFPLPPPAAATYRPQISAAAAAERLEQQRRATLG